MKTIEKHLEKAILNNDIERVAELEKVLERKTLTFRQWVESAKFLPSEGYQSESKILKNCVEVIEYIGDDIIQVLDTGDFKYKKAKSTDLDTIEILLWIDIAEKLWCETC